MKVFIIVYIIVNFNLCIGFSISNKVVIIIFKGKSFSFLVWGYLKDKKFLFDWVFVEYNGFKGYVSIVYL